MKARSLLSLALFAALPLFLSACGEGYEPVRTTEMFPYGNQRTAGSGVAYVRANIMPEKQLILQPAPAPVFSSQMESEKILNNDGEIEELFEKSLQK